MLTVKERLEALCAGKTIVRITKYTNCKYRLTEKRMEKNLGGGWEYTTMSEWLFDESEDNLWSIEPEYPLNIIEAYQEYKKGKTISNDRHPLTVYDNVRGSNNPLFMCMDCEDIDANWRVEE